MSKHKIFLLKSLLYLQSTSQYSDRRLFVHSFTGVHLIWFPNFSSSPHRSLKPLTHLQTLTIIVSGVNSYPPLHLELPFYYSLYIPLTTQPIRTLGRSFSSPPTIPYFNIFTDNNHLSLSIPLIFLFSFGSYPKLLVINGFSYLSFFCVYPLTLFFDSPGLFLNIVLLISSSLTYCDSLRFTGSFLKEFS